MPFWTICRDNHHTGIYRTNICFWIQHYPFIYSIYYYEYDYDYEYDYEYDAVIITQHHFYIINAIYNNGMTGLNIDNRNRNSNSQNRIFKCGW